MSILIDTSGVVAALNQDDQHHKKAFEIMRSALKGNYGTVFISDYIFDEAVTLALVRTGKKKFAYDIARFARAKPIHFIFIEPVDFDNAWDIFKKYEDKHFSFTDCTNIALMERLEIDTIFTFDKDFSGIVNMAF